ncbi:MAG: 8-amino-7-oxononanoate synthase [Verrucomicrobiota bacterium]
MRSLHVELDELREQHLLRELRTVEGPQGREIRLNGRDVLNFSSNDYLGLANSGELKAALVEGVERFGTGAGASQLISGHLHPHRELETALAAFLEKESALVFSSGFSAASGLFSAIAQKGDVVILDKLCHACLIDGARASGAQVRVFPHNNLESLERRLVHGREKIGSEGRLIVVTEAIFSMDGDSPPLQGVIACAKEYGAMLVIDEAHAFGVLGPQGRGLTAATDGGEEVDILLTTLGKSAGLGGGVIAASREIIDLVVNRGRSFIFSTAIPPAVASAGVTAVKIISGGQGDALRSTLSTYRHNLSRALGVTEPGAAILPVAIGREEEAVDASAQMLKNDRILVPAVRYPTVAKGAARLRVSLSAAHTSGDLGRLASALGVLFRENEAAGLAAAE